MAPNPSKTRKSGFLGRNRSVFQRRISKNPQKCLKSPNPALLPDNCAYNVTNIAHNIILIERCEKCLFGHFEHFREKIDVRKGHFSTFSRKNGFYTRSIKIIVSALFVTFAGASKNAKIGVLDDFGKIKGGSKGQFRRKSPRNGVFGQNRPKMSHFETELTYSAPQVTGEFESSMSN